MHTIFVHSQKSIQCIFRLIVHVRLATDLVVLASIQLSPGLVVRDANGLVLSPYPNIERRPQRQQQPPGCITCVRYETLKSYHQLIREYQQREKNQFGEQSQFRNYRFQSYKLREKSFCVHAKRVQPTCQKCVKSVCSNRRQGTYLHITTWPKLLQFLLAIVGNRKSTMLCEPNMNAVFQPLFIVCVFFANPFSFGPEFVRCVSHATEHHTKSMANNVIK